MSPSPPFAQLVSTLHVTMFTAVMQILIAIAMGVLAFALYRLRGYQQTILGELHYHRRMRALDAESFAHLKEQDETIVQHVNVGFERLEEAHDERPAPRQGARRCPLAPLCAAREGRRDRAPDRADRREQLA